MRASASAAAETARAAARVKAFLSARSDIDFSIAGRPIIAGAPMAATVLRKRWEKRFVAGESRLYGSPMRAPGRTSAAMTCAIVALALVRIAQPAVAADASLSADLSTHQMTIASASAGGTVTLFGTVDAPGNIVVVVRGPEAEAAVQRGPFDDLPLTTHRVVFAGVPSFYAVYASAPLDTIMPSDAQALHQIGLANLRFQLQSVESDPATVQAARATLIAERQKSGVYAATVGKVSFVGDHLFRTTLAFPGNAPPGPYFIEVLLLRDRTLVGGQTMSLRVADAGNDIAVHDSTPTAWLFAALAGFAVLAVAGGYMANRRWRERPTPRRLPNTRRSASGARRR